VLDELTPEHVEPLLRGSFGRPYLYAETCESTQRMLPPDGTEGTVALAEQQTEGRGRLGRIWVAPAGTSLLFSVLLYPPVPTERLPELSLVAAEGVAAALRETTGLEPALKHPNDVLVGGRKLCGILAEASEGRVALGIGINVNQTAADLPGDTVTWPTSVRLELGEPVPRGPLLATVLARLEDVYRSWVSASGS
jgi:BirA family transcriptional regulator, biotin operon repressor / biotin---[acetyl-CoA-carboxylase] ligase